MTITAADWKNRNVQPVIRSAMYIKALCENKTIRIDESLTMEFNFITRIIRPRFYPENRKI